MTPSLRHRVRPLQEPKHHVAAAEARRAARETLANLQPMSAIGGASQTEEYYRLIAETIPQIVWTSRPDGYNDHFNRRWFDYTGFTEDETYGETRSALHPDDKDTYNQRWNEAIRTGKPYEIEYRLQRASDGMYRWHLGRAVPVIDAKGNIVKWFGTCTDIHAQKMAEERMREINEELEAKVSERTRELHVSNKQLKAEIAERRLLEEQDKANLERLRTIVDTMPIGILIANDRRKIIHFNMKFCKVFDCVHLLDSPAVGRSLTSIFTKKMGMGHLSAYFRQALSSDARKDIELQTENEKVILCSHLPIIVAGRPREHLFMFRDITRQRRIDKAKSEFMSLASHQLRTPLTSIRWAMSRLERQMLSQQQQRENEIKLIDAAKSGVVRMAETINTMLTISRFEAGKVTLHPQSVSLSKLFKDLKSQFHEEYAKKRQIVDIRCEPRLTLRTDANFLSEVLSNLISNAIKYSPDRSRIRVSAKKRGKDIVIDVRDSGCGIPLSQQGKVFTKFFRGENIQNIDPNGTGLGLYLASLITKMLSGTLTFTSRHKKGTTFTLLLPASVQ
jgi:PAS domain S-box-containing protein